jgi:hypothetical protein
MNYEPNFEDDKRVFIYLFRSRKNQMISQLSRKMKSLNVKRDLPNQ